MSQPARKLSPYEEVRHLIQDADLALWEPTNLAGKLISRYSHGPYSHVGTCSWAGDVLETHEMLQFFGGRTVNLSAMVFKYPGKIHIYRLPGLLDYATSQAQRRRAGEPYGWWDLVGISMRIVTKDRWRMPWRKRLAKVDRKASTDLWERLYRAPLDQPAFCSEAVVSDIRRGGVDLFPNLSAWEISPSALALAANYMFTLI